MRKLLVLVCLVGLASPVMGGELAGVTLPDRAQIGDQELVLNGMGLRKKAVFKIYVAGLYLPAKQTDANAVLAADAPRHLVMHFLGGLATADKMCDAWKDGLEANTPGASAELKAHFDALCSYMVDTEEGMQMIFTYRPGEGTSVTVAGESKGSFAGKEFADALFACWLGPKPPSAAFKQGLLGG